MFFKIDKYQRVLTAIVLKSHIGIFLAPHTQKTCSNNGAILIFFR